YSSASRLPYPPALAYTTLFRSVVEGGGEGRKGGLGHLRRRRLGLAVQGRPPPGGRAPGRGHGLRRDRLRGRGRRDHLQAAHVGRDRKSTRLNSSHVKISYAVFC